MTAMLLISVVGSAPAQRLHRVPPNDEGVATLEARRTAQLAATAGAGVFTGFEFADQVLASGIDFEHRSVDDSLKHWKPVHYDHGNGVAVADVDGDGRLDLYLVTPLGSNGLYRNLGGGRFENVTAEAGVAMTDRIGVTASFGDVDNDGDPDLYVTTVRYGNALFVNDGQGRFRDVAAEAGVAYVGHSSGAVFFDYDLDGLLDLFVTNVGVYTADEKGPGGFYLGLEDAFKGHLFPERAERSILYRNLGGLRFRDVSQEVGLLDDSWTGDASAVDLNGDRYPDLYVLNMQGDDHYWGNVGGGRFEEKRAALFPKTPWGAMGIKFFDWNNDGLMDLYLTDMHSDMHPFEVHPLLDEKRKYELGLADGADNIYGNAFYERRADGSFEEISDRNGSENFWPWGFTVADLNADGWQDVFVAASMSFPFRYGFNSLLLNDRGATFVDAAFALGVEPRRDGRTHKPLFDIDCLGADASHPLCEQVPGLQGTIEGALGTRSSVAFDADGDGDLDIVTNEFNDVPQVLLSDLSERRAIRYLEVALRGTRSNRDGLGALVTVRAGGDAYTQYHDGKSGYLSQSSQPLYFGLGDHQSVESVEVLWPSGQRQAVSEGITVNGRLEVVEEAPAP